MKYLSEQYYEEKAKEFYAMKLGTVTMKELCSRFLSLLRYVPYFIDERPKIQLFLSCLPSIYKEIIEYGNPKTLEEAMRKENLCHDQNKNKKDNVTNWKGKRHENFEHKKKGIKFYKNPRTNYQGYEGSNYKGNKPPNPITNKER